MFDITGKTLKPITEARRSDEMERWWNILAEEGRARKATESRQHSLSSTETEALARQAFEEVSSRAADAGVALPNDFILRLIGELSGMGPLLELIARKVGVWPCYARRACLLFPVRASTQRISRVATAFSPPKPPPICWV